MAGARIPLASSRAVHRAPAPAPGCAADVVPCSGPAPSRRRRVEDFTRLPLLEQRRLAALAHVAAMTGAQRGRFRRALSTLADLMIVPHAVTAAPEHPMPCRWCMVVNDLAALAEALPAKVLR